QAAWLVILGVVLTLIFGGAYLTQIANFATVNREIEGLIGQRDRLERENEAYRAQIAEFQTVPRLLQQAEVLGFRPATSADIEYLVVHGYNPNRSETVVSLVIEDDLDETPQYDATFRGWLSQQWDILREQFASFGR
ncbi:MAG: hypothetical protein Q9P44_09515, partial [Anaerolineae bacterium]|nr:hypothetical protein [Anaerolineae bacterium]